MGVRASEGLIPMAFEGYFWYNCWIELSLNYGLRRNDWLGRYRWW